MKFLLKKKVFVHTTKDKLSSCKIGPTNRSEPLIKLRKDEERTEKENVFQSSDQGESKQQSFDQGKVH
jgi:hypothetical protein